MKEFIDRFRKVIESLEGAVSQVDDWGLRDLAYRIQKQSKGHYALIQYRSSAKAVEELERNMRLTDGILRYLTVRVDEQTRRPEGARAKASEQQPARSSEEEAAKAEPEA